jgi:OOP family OmpA-OmpF porin
MQSIVIAVLALSSATLAFAQQQDVEGSKDHPLISRYPGSVITEYSAREFDEIHAAAGKDPG